MLQKKSIGSLESDLSISVALLESGVYFLNIIAEDKEENIKFIVK